MGKTMRDALKQPNKLCIKCRFYVTVGLAKDDKVCFARKRLSNNNTCPRFEKRISPKGVGSCQQQSYQKKQQEK